MPLKQKLLKDLKEAMKAGDRERLGVLRLLTSAIHNKEIEKRSKSTSEELTEEEVTNVLSSEAKKRRESIDFFKKGGREDLAKNEQKEAEIIQRYLPKQMSPEEIEKEVGGILQGAPELSDFGLAMKEVMKTLKGKADAKIISEVIKKKLGDGK